MILASVLALFYRAAIGSQKELKIMTVGATPPPAEAGVSGWVGAAGASGCSCFSRERLSAEFFQQKGVQTHLHKISINITKASRRPVLSIGVSEAKLIWGVWGGGSDSGPFGKVRPEPGWGELQK